MVAPRFLACSSSSNTSMPEPSPNTKPSRCLSNGRDAFVGLSLLVDRAPGGIMRDQRDQVVEVLTPFARAKVDAEARPVHFVVFQQPGVLQGLPGRAQSEARVGAAIFPAVLAEELLDAVVLHLGGE